jgi:hypothetical protein
MEQMIYNILLALSLLLNAYYILKLEHEAKLDRELNDRRDAANSKALAHMATNFARMSDRLDGYCDENKKLREQLDAAEKKLEERLSEAEKRLEELPLAAMEEEAERMRAFNDGIGEIMSFNPDVPKLNKDGLRHG